MGGKVGVVVSVGEGRRSGVERLRCNLKNYSRPADRPTPYVLPATTFAFSSSRFSSFKLLGIGIGWISIRFFERFLFSFFF